MINAYIAWNLKHCHTATFKATLKQTLLSVKYFFGPRTIIDLILGKYWNFDRLVFFFAWLAQGHVTMMSSFQRNNLQKFCKCLCLHYWLRITETSHFATDKWRLEPLTLWSEVYHSNHSPPGHKTLCIDAKLFYFFSNKKKASLHPFNYRHIISDMDHWKCFWKPFDKMI